MDFNKEIYPEEMQEKLETAVENSAENFIQNKIDEENPSCEECGSESLQPEVENKQKEFSETAVCSACGNVIDFDVEPGDLKEF